MPTQNGSQTPIYEVGVQELHHISQDEGQRRAVDHDLNEARGRDGARLHVTLKAITEADRRQNANTQAALAAIDALAKDLQERAQQLASLIQTFEAVTDKHFVNSRGELVALGAAERQHFEALAAQVQEARSALWTQADGSLQSVSSQLRESTERVAVDVRKLRDEVVSLVDSRMNQADASFAALRGDVEVVKYLVMDLIKDRIGRTDPKSKTF